MSAMYKEAIESNRIQGEMYCIADELIDAGLGNGKLESCGSSDAMSAYLSEFEDDSTEISGYCFSCCQSFNHKLFGQSSCAADFGIEGGLIVEKKEFTKMSKAVPMTKQEVVTLIKEVGYKSGDYRGIKDEYSQFFGHLTKLDKRGNVVARYYPETKAESFWPTGYKCRNHPKDFRWGKLGLTGLACELSGQSKFRDYVGHRDLLIVGGEEDKAAAFQMLRENQIRKGQEDYAPVAVVSPTTGETSAVKQIQSQYEWICGFKNIIIGFDNDDAGLSAANAVANVLPRDKVKIATWTGKDPNAMLQAGKEKQFMSDFYNATPYVRNGIITSIEADKSVEEELLRPKMSLPDFMAELQSSMAGGIPLGYIVNWIAESGIGKSTLVNEAIRHWIYNSPYKIGILSLELSAPQYMIAMISREVGFKINLIECPQEAVEFINKPHVLEARRHLTTTEDGDSRFVILDEREGNLGEVKRQCETLVNQHGCQVLIIDPIQDLFEGVSMDEQNGFLKWMKTMVKKGVTFNNVCHVKKGNVSTDKEGKRILRELSEDDVHGISAIVKSAGANIFMSRNKYAESWVEKNTTFTTLGKCRWTGKTGRSGSWFYHLNSHTMYDLYKYFDDNPTELPDGYDLKTNPFNKSEGKVADTNFKFNTKEKSDPVKGIMEDFGKEKF